MTEPSEVTRKTDRQPIDTLVQYCFERLNEYEQTAQTDPLTNSVRQLAHELLLMEDKGDISEQALIAIEKSLTGHSLVARAQNFAKICNQDVIAPETLLADDPELSIDAFSERFCKTQYGIVFTAHPTFALSREAREMLAARISQILQSGQAPGTPIMPGSGSLLNETITLKEEHADALDALDQARTALEQLARKILIEARRRFPDRWTDLVPVPINLACWVGYDLDGRTDISWSESLRVRLFEKSLQLSRYADQLSALPKLEQDSEARQFILDLRKASDLSHMQSEAFQGELEDAQQIARAANMLSEQGQQTLTDFDQCIGKVTRLVQRPDMDEETRLDLCIVRSSMKMTGAGTSLIHFRINAAQVKSALRHEFKLQNDVEFVDRTTFDLISRHIETVEPVKINAASVFNEPMTARRQLMLCAQILKHIDAQAPIRFLIAESETPATILGVLYLAKRYGIADKIDISPLFETPSGIEDGGRFLEQLLRSQNYVDYLKARGCVSIQIGFSDSGRFMGQISANLAIERLQSQFADVLQAAGLGHLDVIIFNTHGESMGRGAYPGTIKQRCDYLLTPWLRARYHQADINLIAESSFQGGDGFLHFATPDIAYRTVNKLFGWLVQPGSKDTPRPPDKFYAEPNYSWDVFQRILNWHKDLFEREDYHVSIGAFAFNLLPVTGSRKARRQSGSALMGPKSLRAIPHNAILHQLAIPANVFGGIGTAAGQDIGPILEHIEGSERLYQVLGLAREARRLTSLPVLRAYAVLYDPVFWSAKASSAREKTLSYQCLEIAQRLQESAIAHSIQSLGTHLSADLNRLDRILRHVFGPDVDQERYAYRRPLHALHAVRQAQIMRAFLLIASLPSISTKIDLDRGALFGLAFALRFDELAQRLDELFPVSADAETLSQLLTEPADNFEGAERGYPQIHRDIIDPLGRLHHSMQEASIGISNVYGAFG